MGKSETVDLALKEDLFLTLPKATAPNLDIKVQYKGPLIAPVKQGTEVATLKIEVPGMPTIEKPLIAKESVESLGLFAQTLQKAKMLIAGQ